MPVAKPQIEPVIGKTYSLFGESETTDDYYAQIRELTDFVLETFPDPEAVLIRLRKASRKRHHLSRQIGRNGQFSFLPFVVNTLFDGLSAYTPGVKDHLKGLTFSERWDSALRTSREQYYLYMMEIELVNRLNKQDFKKCEYKIALLPHCLHDLTKDCLAEQSDLEYVCKRCSKNCFIRHTSDILKAHDVNPYILMTVGYSKLLRKLRAKVGSLGVLGMACVPELSRGMRACMRAGIPAVGIPLDANRCIRWMGEYHKNSVNLEELEKLVS
jgi:hypothetical protein